MKKNIGYHVLHGNTIVATPATVSTLDSARAFAIDRVNARGGCAHVVEVSARGGVFLAGIAWTAPGHSGARYDRNIGSHESVIAEVRSTFAAARVSA